MCEVCDGYADAVPAGTPDQLALLLARARQGEERDEIAFLDGDAALRHWQPGQPLPAAGQPRTCRWLCQGCSRLFLLELGSRHTLGDGWRPLFGN